MVSTIHKSAVWRRFTKIHTKTKTTTYSCLLIRISVHFRSRSKIVARNFKIRQPSGEILQTTQKLIEFEKTEIICTIWSHKMQQWSNFGTWKISCKGVLFYDHKLPANTNYYIIAFSWSSGHNSQDKPIRNFKDF